MNIQLPILDYDEKSYNQILKIHIMEDGLIVFFPYGYDWKLN